MAFTIGSAQSAVQNFSQFKDTSSSKLAQPKLCGERAYKLTAPAFLSLKVPTDPWTMAIEIELFTSDATQAGSYTASLLAELVAYPATTIKVDFNVKLSYAVNHPPSFEKKISFATVQMTKTP